MEFITILFFLFRSMEGIYKLHFIPQKGGYIAFHPDTFSLFEVNQQTYECIKELERNISPIVISKEKGISKDALDYLIHKLQPLKSARHTLDDDRRVVKKVSRITLHVTNDCNLRCRYCYAQGGKYLCERKLMSLEKANDFINFLKESFDKVANIVFFGGEPFLNVPVISYICEKIHELYVSGQISYLPRFGAVTNGYFDSEDVFEVIKRYFSFITVSIDGDERCHDINRVSTQGKGTFFKVSKFIDRLLDVKSISVQYEATYTRKHIEMGITREQVRDFLGQRFGIAGIITDEYTMEQESMHKKGNSSFLKRGRKEAYWDILPRFIEKTPAQMCEIGREIFSISVDGDIYPCHMNTGEKENCLGNIAGDNVFRNPAPFIKEHPFVIHSSKNNPQCRSCWANTLCGGCTRLWFYSPQDKKFNTEPYQDTCQINKNHFEEALCQLVSVRKSPKKWAELLDILHETKHISQPK